MDAVVKHKVTVLMPVYNGEKYLREAVNSVLNQTFKDFELLAIDDGSKDKSLEILNSFNDPRVKVVANDTNIKLIDTLNKGLQLIQSEYIVRMDCDDICLPNRIEKQVKFMDAHPNVGASSSYFYLMRGKSDAIMDVPVGNKFCRAFLLFNSPLVHPGVIMRANVLKENKISYSKEFLHAEDYQMWRSIAAVSEIDNLAEALLKYRVHESQVSGLSTTQLDKAKTLEMIRSEELKNFGIAFTEEEIKIHHLISNGEKPQSELQLRDASEWLLKLAAHNSSFNKLDASSLNQIIIERWLRFCINFYGVKKGLIKFYSSGINKQVKISFKEKRKLFKQFYYSYKRLRMK